MKPEQEKTTEWAKGEGCITAEGLWESYLSLQDAETRKRLAAAMANAFNQSKVPNPDERDIRGLDDWHPTEDRWRP